MANHLPHSLTTFPKPDLIEEEQRFDEDTVSLQAEKILFTMAFSMVFKAALELGVIVLLNLFKQTNTVLNHQDTSQRCDIRRKRCTQFCLWHETFRIHWFEQRIR
ncbi:hypothetical protein V5N11_000843 [Cardamine amara subsp. amara]|uniref:Uncharacterized protein n=1 Tax=Cardamine amara subsp. amara TaxID=228776 RepID=A0ABD0Z5V5_CARAN